MNKDIFVKLLRQRQFKAVRSILDVMNEVDIASLLSNLDGRELALAFRLIPKDKAAEVFSNMETSMQTGIHKEAIYTCYVTDKRKLLGIVSAKDLMTSDNDLTVHDLMETEIISVNTHTDQEAVAQLFTYFETSVFAHAKHRILWLLILMFSATVTGTIITKYEDAFAAIPLLVAFIPMLMDTGGNCGSQSSTLIIRGIALNEIRFQDLFRVIFKEFRVSLIVGAALALANGARILLMYRSASLALVIGLSLIGTVILAKLIGCVLPLFAKRIGLDPAIMASPLITTLVDTCSILIYFNIAAMLFKL